MGSNLQNVVYQSCFKITEMKLWTFDHMNIILSTTNAQCFNYHWVSELRLGAQFFQQCGPIWCSEWAVSCELELCSCTTWATRLVWKFITELCEVFSPCSSTNLILAQSFKNGVSPCTQSKNKIVYHYTLFQDVKPRMYQVYEEIRCVMKWLLCLFNMFSLFCPLL